MSSEIFCIVCGKEADLDKTQALLEGGYVMCVDCYSSKEKSEAGKAKKGEKE